MLAPFMVSVLWQHCMIIEATVSPHFSMKWRERRVSASGSASTRENESFLLSENEEQSGKEGRAVSSCEL